MADQSPTASGGAGKSSLPRYGRVIVKLRPELEALCWRMIQELEIKDRRHYFKLYPRCFIGSEAVNWLLQARIVSTREGAVDLGNQLQAAGVFAHVAKEHQFLDGNYFYRFAFHEKRSHQPTPSTSRSQQDLTAFSSSVSSAPPSLLSDAPGFNPDAHLPPVPTMELLRSLQSPVLDLERSTHGDIEVSYYEPPSSKRSHKPSPSGTSSASASTPDPTVTVVADVDLPPVPFDRHTSLSRVPQNQLLLASVERLQREVALLQSNNRQLVQLQQSHNEAERKRDFLEHVRYSGIRASKQQLRSGQWRADEIPSVTKCGFLSKKRQQATNFLSQKRWFVLFGNELFYFKNKDDREPRGELPLLGCDVRIVNSEDRCFQLNVRASSVMKSYFLFAPNETVLDEWVSAIADASILFSSVEQRMGWANRPARTPLFFGFGLVTDTEHADGSSFGPTGVNVSSGSAYNVAQPQNVQAMEQLGPFFASFVASLCGGKETVSSKYYQQTQRLLAHPVAVPPFCTALNAHRCKPQGQLVKGDVYNFRCLCSLIDQALLTTFQSEDYRSTRSLMNMANTFFHNTGDDRRVYVMDLVRSHKIWNSMRVWDGIFYEALVAEHRKVAPSLTRDFPQLFAAPAPTSPVLPSSPLVGTGASEDAKHPTASASLDFAATGFSVSVSTHSMLAPPGARSAMGASPRIQYDSDSDTEPSSTAPSQADKGSRSKLLVLPSPPSEPAPAPPAGVIPPASTTASNTSGSNRAEQERELRERESNIAFGQLLSFANEMVQFKLSESTVSHFVSKMCIATKLSVDQQRTLSEHLAALFHSSADSERQPSS